MIEAGPRKGVLPKPPSEDTQIWRYLSFEHFMAVLEYDALWFNRADLFENPYEGVSSKKSLDTRKKRIKEIGATEKEADKLSNALSKSEKLFRESSYINSWHCQSAESAYLWNAYFGDNQGIAIQTNVGDLKKALRRSGKFINREDTPVPDGVSGKKIITMAPVEYIDYNKETIPEANQYGPLFHKRRSFSHENEFRILFSRIGERLEDDGEIAHNVELPAGEYIELDLNLLVDSVYVEPTSPAWVVELVEKITKRYNLTVDVHQSSR